MATTGIPATGTYSAAVTLSLWIQSNGREPRPLECCASNGLMSHRTYYRRLPGSTFSAIISNALAMTSNLVFSHGSALPTVSHVSSVRMRTCLGLSCEARFPYEGPQIGFCPKCRKVRRKHAVEDDWYDTAAIPGPQARKLGLNQDAFSDLMEM